MLDGPFYEDRSVAVHEILQSLDLSNQLCAANSVLVGFSGFYFELFDILLLALSKCTLEAVSQEPQCL